MAHIVADETMECTTFCNNGPFRTIVANYFISVEMLKRQSICQTRDLEVRPPRVKSFLSAEERDR